MIPWNRQKKALLALILPLGLALALASCSGPGTENLYHGPAQVEAFLDAVHEAHPDITLVENVGTSVEGRAIKAIVISDHPGTPGPKPRVRLTGAIHGDERITCEILLRLVTYLADRYATDADVKALVDARQITVIPMMNPDGAEHNRRWNANDVDLNRNFGFAWAPGFDHGTAAFSEIESQAVRDYSLAAGFHLSVTFHAGAVIVNMPFDYASEHDGGDVPAEYDLVKHLALEYSTNGNFLSIPGLMEGTYVDRGTINGGDWYIVNGSLQDWSYMAAGCLDLTVEMSLDDPDTESGVLKSFEDNRGSILACIDAAGIGVYGRVTDGVNPVAGAVVTVAGGDIVVRTDAGGYYHRLLLPGSYDITFSAAGYAPHTETGFVVTGRDLLDIVLTP